CFVERSRINGTIRPTLAGGVLDPLPLTDFDSSRAAFGCFATVLSWKGCRSHTKLPARTKRAFHRSCALGKDFAEVDDCAVGRPALVNSAGSWQLSETELHR